MVLRVAGSNPVSHPTQDPVSTETGSHFIPFYELLAVTDTPDFRIYRMGDQLGRNQNAIPPQRAEKIPWDHHPGDIP